MFINEPAAKLPKTSPVTIKRLRDQGIVSFFDLLSLFPNRYTDSRTISTIQDILKKDKSPLFEHDQDAEKITIRGTVDTYKNEYTRRGFRIQKAQIRDETGTIELVWFNQPFLVSVIKPGRLLQVSGTVKRSGASVSFLPEEYDILNSPQDTGIHTGRLVPVYPEKRGLSSRTIRDKIALTLHLPDYTIDEMIPADLLEKFRLIEEGEAFQKIHFPADEHDIEEARRRLSFDELFIMQVFSAIIKKQWQKEVVSSQFSVENFQKEIDVFIKSFPFTLTDAQTKSLSEILNDLSSKTPMNRLLQGDVGSGKTVVAAAACFVAYLNGFQSLFMAPTEILAKQHYKTLSKLFKNHLPKVSLVTSSQKPKKDDLDNASIIVGTHALISKKASFDRVGLVVVDEQHKFGVVQRARLKEKGLNPHLLTMTATPIPRTVYLTLFGELSRSIIDMMPRGRKIVKTFLVPAHKRQDSYEWIKKNIVAEKTQVFVVCPLIEESVVETLKTVKAAAAEFEKLKKKFSRFSVGLLHGRLKEKEKDEVMGRFAKGELDILVSTSVVEVGVDIPNATIILIEAAERFGLAQLHQLRGRVGRSDKQAYCLLFTEKEEPPVLQRLKTFARITNGFELAEYDLALRGVGEIYGTKQHGIIDLKIASLSDAKLIEDVHRAVLEFTENYRLEDYPILRKRIEEYQTNLIARD